MRIFVTGASGFIGSHLVSFLQEKRDEVIPSFLDGCDAVIHLAGASIATGRWTDKRKRELISSRIDTTRHLAQLISQSHNPPKVVIVASAVGFYGDQKERILTEEDPQGEGFLADLCGEWESIAQSINSPKTRVVSTRFGIVLSPDGGMLAQLIPLFKRGLGMKIGTGEQYISWIALSDLLAALDYILHTPSLRGPVNCVAPKPITQAQFAEALASTFHTKVRFRLPAFFVQLLMGQKGRELLLFSQRALPQALEKSGFQFRFNFSWL